MFFLLLHFRRRLLPLHEGNVVFTHLKRLELTFVAFPELLQPLSEPFDDNVWGE